MDIPTKSILKNLPSAEEQYRRGKAAGLSDLQMLDNCEDHIRAACVHIHWLARSARSWDVDNDIREEAERIIAARKTHHELVNLVFAQYEKAA